VRLREVASAPFGNQPSFADEWLWVAATQTLQLRQHPQSHFLNRQKITDELNVKNVVASTSPRITIVAAVHRGSISSEEKAVVANLVPIPQIERRLGKRARYGGANLWPNFPQKDPAGS
jgi:hypothetical protein